MTAIVQLVICLSILLIAIGAGLSFTATKTQDVLDCYSCDGDLSTDWRWNWPGWRTANPPPAVWQQIYQLLVEDTNIVCGTNQKSWSDYVKKKRESGFVTSSYCWFLGYVRECDIRSLVGLDPKEDTEWKVFTYYARWKEGVSSLLSKVPRFDPRRTWQELRQVADTFIKHMKTISDKIPHGSRTPGIWNAVLCLFFIWRTMVALYSKPGMSHGADRLTDSRKVAGALTRAIGQKFVALKDLGTSRNFHMFHLLSKATHDTVFMKCLRSDAMRAARIGLAREFRVLGTISHQNVIRLGGWMRAGAACSLTLEWAKYGNLQKAVLSHVTSFRLGDKMTVFRQVVKAVQYLHHSKVAHLNIRAKSIMVFSKWSSVKLSGFSRSVMITRKRLCNRFDLHPAAAPADVVIRKELYDPIMVDSWALGSLLLYLLTGDNHAKRGKSSLPMIEALGDYNMKCKKIVLTLISRLMSSEPRARPDPSDILRFLSGLDK